MDGAGSYSVAHRAGLLPTELTGIWGWILLRSPHRGRGSAPALAPTKQRPVAAPRIDSSFRVRASWRGSYCNPLQQKLTHTTRVEQQCPTIH